LLGIPERIGFDSEKARKFLTDPKQLPAGVHVTAGLATLLSASPAPPRLQAPHINLSPRHPLPEKFVVLHPFAGSPKRCLPLDGWKVLAEYIRAKGFSVIWFGSRFDFDAVPTEFAAPHELLGHFVDSNDMPASMSMLIKAHAFVGHDSGPLHIAGALGVPVLGLYLPGDWPRTRVTGPRENLCHVIHRQSPGQISTQDLTAAFNQLLATIS
jgi:ADP-heptose:LPS heptosyltransferase